MIEENNDILLAGNHALGYLTRPMHKKYSATFICGYDHFFILSTSALLRIYMHLQRPCLLRILSHQFDTPPHSHVYNARLP